MAKYLIMSLGTGEGVEHGLTQSIRTLNPDCIIFLGSNKSPQLLDRLKSLVPEFIPKFQPLRCVSDESDVEKCAIDSRILILELLEQGVPIKDIEVDFTSGTKAMTAGLCIAAVALGVGRLVYVTGDRDSKTGRVITGTERVLTVYPMRLIIQNRRRELRTLFNKRLFADGLNIIDEVMKSCALPEIQEEFLFWKKLFDTYYYWDKFGHLKASLIIKKISKGYLKKFKLDLSGNKEILGRITGKLSRYKEKIKSRKADKKELLSLKFSLEILVDLFANAERRGQEKKYDDAVARLYRATELIVQLALARYGIDTSNIDLQVISDKVRPLFPEVSQGEKVVSIGLDRSYQILASLGEEKANLYLENKRLKDLLTSRNSSILAHGTVPVEERTYRDLKGEVLKLAREFVPEMTVFLKKASFPRIEVAL